MFCVMSGEREMGNEGIQMKRKGKRQSQREAYTQKDLK